MNLLLRRLHAVVLGVYSVENCFLNNYSIIAHIILGYPNHCRRSKVKRGLGEENLVVEPMLPGFHEFIMNHEKLAL